MEYQEKEKQELNLPIQTVMVLTKEDYLIRVKKRSDESYFLEFSKDGFKTIQTKEYPDRKSLRDVLEEQYTLEELVGI